MKGSRIKEALSTLAGVARRGAGKLRRAAAVGTMAVGIFAALAATAGAASAESTIIGGTSLWGTTSRFGTDSSGALSVGTTCDTYYHHLSGSVFVEAPDAYPDGVYVWVNVYVRVGNTQNGPWSTWTLGKYTITQQLVGGGQWAWGGYGTGWQFLHQPADILDFVGDGTAWKYYQIGVSYSWAPPGSRSWLTGGSFVEDSYNTSAGGGTYGNTVFSSACML